ncbi:hypothetical protein UlMin_021204 [Ulmus minor]
MASSGIEVEDQTDEDFFDKLVDDNTDCVGSVSNLVENNELDEGNVISNLSVSEVGSAPVDSNGDKDEVSSPPLDAHVESVVDKESETKRVGNGNDISEEGKGDDECALDDGTMDKSKESVAREVKEIQWDSFQSGLNVHGGNKYGSFSDLFNDLGENSEDPFANVSERDNSGAQSNVGGGIVENALAHSGSNAQQLQHQCSGNAQEQNLNGQDLNSCQYWESVYPGWKYDPSNQWYQEGYDANATTTGNVSTSANAGESFNLNSQSSTNANVLDQSTNAYYLQQTAQSVAGSVAEGCTSSNVSEWNQVSQGNTGYPAHMFFDPQYPGWYYDTSSQEWKVLDSYNPAVDYNQQYLKNNGENYGSQGLAVQDVASWDGSVSSYNQQNNNMLPSQHVAESVTIGYSGSQKLREYYSLRDHRGNSGNQQMGISPSVSIPSYEIASQSFEGSFGGAGFEGINHREKFTQHHYQTKELNQEGHLSAHFDSQEPVHFSQQPPQSGASFSRVASEERTSAGRPPHALVTFGFGGKLIVMKDGSSFQANSTQGNQDAVGIVINVLNMMEVFMEKPDTPGFQTVASDYIRVLCQQSFPGPLVGGSVGSRELNKWIDEKITNYETPYMDLRNRDLLRLLFSLLKISVQYYGKLRSPFGTDQTLKENDGPESAIAKLFASTRRNQGYGAFTHCLQNVPSEAQIQATALEVQNLLVSGRKKEALEFAQEGQLWGPALVLALQLGDQFYGDTVKKMALKQLITGSPLRTLCLLIAGQPADVFSNATTRSTQPALNVFQQRAQVEANRTLEEWKENLAIITANRTKDDELVIIHLGDCLWKDTGEITAAHICYLVAEANFESYSDSARLCLIGSDHWKFPRTFASPEAIQRTELYEYSKVLGNSQFLILPFQPYKLIYAHMLAEVGKVADALKYCQAIMKSLKTGRSPEVDTWRHLVSSLEERIKTQQQGGYGTTFAPKFVNKLRNFLDSTAHRVVGGLPPPVPLTTQGIAQRNDYAHQLVSPRVPNSPSTTTMPSRSTEPLIKGTGDSDRKTKHNRSISEPDFGKSPIKVDSSKKDNSSNTREKPPAPTGSRFGRFGSQLFQKTVGLVIRSRPDRQAKLGEQNKFYYDEKLKRWVEEGAEPPAEEVALPPPPTTAAFQSGTQDYSKKETPKHERSQSVPEFSFPNSSEKSSGMPPIPPGSNQFSARGRISARSRYVDTFNKNAGTATKLFQSPSIPAAAKPAGGSTPKFFMPAQVAASEETSQVIGEIRQEAVMTNDNLSTSFKEDTFFTPRTSISTPPSTPTPTPMQRFPSMDNIANKTGEMAKSNIPLPPHSRRTASWSGSFDARSPPMLKEIRPLGEALGMPPSLYTLNDLPPQIPRNGDSFGDLQEVRL